MMLSNTTVITDVDDLMPAGCSCSKCDWEGVTKDCYSEMWGEWTEENTFIIDYCPICGSVIENYFHTDEE